MASRRAAASSLSVKSPSELRLEQFQCWSNRRFWAASHLGASANQDDMINVPRRKPDDWPRPVPHKLKLSERQRCILNTGQNTGWRTLAECERYQLPADEAGDVHYGAERLKSAGTSPQSTRHSAVGMVVRWTACEDTGGPRRGAELGTFCRPPPFSHPFNSKNIAVFSLPPPPSPHLLVPTEVTLRC